MATARHVTAWAGRMKYQAAWFLLNRGYNIYLSNNEIPVTQKSFTKLLHFEMILSWNLLYQALKICKLSVFVF